MAAQAQFQMLSGQQSNSVGAEGHSDWIEERKTDQGGGRLFVMRQSKAIVPIKYLGPQITTQQGGGSSGVKLWAEDGRSNDSWNPMVLFTLPKLNLRCEKSTEISAVLKTVEEFLRRDVQEHVSAVGSHLTQEQKKISGEFYLGSFSMKPSLVFEGEPFEGGTMEFLPETSCCRVELSLAVHQHAAAKAQGCCLLM